MKLETAINNLPRRLADKFDALPDLKKREVCVAYARHLRACEKSQCGADPMWMYEAVSELGQGRNICQK